MPVESALKNNLKYLDNLIQRFGVFGLKKIL